MQKILTFLKKEYKNAYVLGYKKAYSEPKIYNAKGNLSVRWYVYYAYRNPETNKLVKRTPIYAGINQFKTLKKRKEAIKILR